METVISHLWKLGKAQTAENYTSTMNSFKRFTGGRDVKWSQFSPKLMMEYEAWLKSGGISRNTASFYNRILRAVYNRAAENGLTVRDTPFRHVYTGIEKTVKRALPLGCIRRIKSLDLTENPGGDYARDMFLFSFYTRGMSFVDMAFLKKTDLRSGALTYCRRKTGRRLIIRWEPCMQEIVDKYAAATAGTGFLLPIIARPGNADFERIQYKRALRRVNKNLKVISSMIGLKTNLTTYVSRHSWANIAQSQNCPISVISRSLGHESEMTTRIYLDSVDTATVDKANNSILNLLKQKC